MFLQKRFLKICSKFIEEHPCGSAISKNDQKQPNKCPRKKRCFQNMQQIYPRTLMPRYNFNKVAKQLLQSNYIKITLKHGFSPVNLLHIFRISFYKNITRWLLMITYFKKTEHIIHRKYNTI